MGIKEILAAKKAAAEVEGRHTLSESSKLEQPKQPKQPESKPELKAHTIAEILAARHKVPEEPQAPAPAHSIKDIIAAHHPAPVQAPIYVAEAQAAEEHKSGWRSNVQPVDEMSAEQEADWYLARWSKDVQKASDSAAKEGARTEVLMILADKLAEQQQTKEEPLALSKPQPPKEDAATVLRRAAKPMSLAERIAAKKAAALQAGLVQEPSNILSADYVDTTGATAIPAVEAATGTASAAPGYARATAIAQDLPLKTFDLAIELNEDQIKSKDMAMAGQSFCLIGPAGSGKTTTQREVAATLLEQGRLHKTSFKVQGSNGQRVDAPSIAFVAYTRRAAANLQRAVHKLPALEEALRYNIMTIHALLEFEPVFYYDDEKQKETMRFEPQRHAANPLDITHLVIEEASMVGLDLWTQLYDALPRGVQIIFIGDINQLPPVFGPSILNYALVQLPVVELRKVYRQAGDSRILENAHRILAGKAELDEGADFQIMEGKQPIQVGQAKMAITLGKVFEQWHEQGHYDPEQDMILSPFNKQDLGTDNMNRFIAQFLGQKRDAIVYEIIAGFTKHYLAVGDRVMCNKQDGVIEEIVHNGNYMGQAPQPASKALTRFGLLILDHPDHDGPALEDQEVATLSYENFNLAALEEQEAERKQQASHIVKVRLLDSGALIELTGAGDFGPQVFSLGYVLTVHKAQGCEWRKVFFIMHKDHATMHYRELVYTATTRAREYFLWIAKRCYIEKAISNPRIKGNCLADKIEYFNANLDMAMQVRCVK